MLALLWFVVAIAVADLARVRQCPRRRLDRDDRRVARGRVDVFDAARIARARARRGARDPGARAAGARASPQAVLRACAAWVPQSAAADVADGARGARGRHRVVGRRAVLGQARLAQAARRSARDAHPGRAALPRRRGGDARRDGVRVGDDEHLQGPAARGLAVHQEQGLPRNDHSEGVRRPRLLRLRALGGRAEALDALRHDGGDGARAEFARTGRAAPELRHRGAEAPLPAAAREGPRDPVLRADESVRRLGCGVDPRLRHRVLGRASRRARARPQGDVGQALHHARPRRDATRSRVSRATIPST